ncbi:hypothetical protein Hanom_Chr04g00384821 [Helianthus anomalus]
MAFSCSGLTLKLHVLERPCMFSFMISILNDCVQRWCDEKGTTNLSFFYVFIYKLLRS